MIAVVLQVVHAGPERDAPLEAAESFLLGQGGHDGRGQPVGIGSASKLIDGAGEIHAGSVTHGLQGGRRRLRPAVRRKVITLDRGREMAPAMFNSS